MIRNFFRQSQPWTKNISPVLGRWNTKDNIIIKIDFANYDNCGDTVCGNYAEKLSKSSEKSTINPQDIKKNENIENKKNIKKIKNSKQDMIDDYNIRWKQNLTMEEYDKYFK